jgi:alpha-amylase/alpha-mannosidase (GH57 family)
MKSVIFSFATHNHQPLGNFDYVIEEAYEKSYLPFFDLAAKYPIRFATHFTGILLDWLQEKHPEHIVGLRTMVERNQLEIISGGFFEPILSVIPPQDQQAQIKMLSQRILELFGYEPRGMWLAERVWEQPLASVLHDANIRYVLLDDTHFLYAGLRDEDLNGYYLTEDRGKTLAVFPISKALRYTIPFAPVDETIRVLRDAASESGINIVTFADDGEKFGVWPRTFDHVYRQGWLEEFFRKLSENASWINALPPAEAMQRVAPRGRIYLPNASYAEMMEWSLPSANAMERYEQFLHDLDEDKEAWEPYRQFVRGGYWRNFFAKYPETNQLHKHMLRTSARAQAANLPSAVQEKLLAAQCNDPFWHGVFGGIYLANLRHANYSALVEADKLLDEAEALTGVRIETSDFDCDGAEEVILESKSLSVYVKPSLGGMIAEIDFKPRNFNATNIISRQPEAYHSKLTKATTPAKAGGTKSIHDMVEAKEVGLERVLAYDWYRHGCLIEHFLTPEASVDDLKMMRFRELGDFVTSAFTWGWSHEQNCLTMERYGQLHISPIRPIRLIKKLEISETTGDLQVTYTLTNESQEPLRLRFASEWSFNLLAPSAHDRYYKANGARLETSQMNSSGSVAANNLRLVDEYLRLAIGVTATDCSDIIRFPIESVSLSEAGFERIFQGSIVMPVWNVELAGGDTWNASLAVAFESL